MNVPNSRCASWALARYTENLVIKREVYVDLLATKTPPTNE